MQKPVKIRALGKLQRVGIAANSLKDVLQKGCDKFKLPWIGTTVHLEYDGTLIEDEDYFQTLENNTYIVLVIQSQRWEGGLNRLREVIEQIRRIPIDDLHIQIQALVKENPSETIQVLMDFVDLQQGNIEAENKDEDPDWFKDVEPHFKTKSKVMSFKAKERVRGYFTKTKEMLGVGNYTNDANTRRKEVIRRLNESLKINKFHRDYFSRTSTHDDRLCDKRGWFKCEGAYDLQMCSSWHMINPYRTRDSMVLFSTWNLDHVIEKSCSVIPALKEAIQNCPQGREVNNNYFYRHLFTRDNLKLVDIRCHIKTRHPGRMDRNQFYI